MDNSVTRVGGHAVARPERYEYLQRSLRFFVGFMGGCASAKPFAAWSQSQLLLVPEHWFWKPVSFPTRSIGLIEGQEMRIIEADFCIIRNHAAQAEPD